VSGASVALSVYYFATFAALGVFFPYFPTWLEARGITGIRMGAILALRPVLGVVAPLVIGLLADRLALRGSLLRVACAGSVLSIAALATFGTLGIQLDFWPLFAVIAVFAFFRGPMLMLADTVALEGESSYGRLRLWGSVGFMVTALAAGWFVDATDLALLPSVVASVLVAALLAALPLPTRSASPPRPVLRDAWRLATSGDYALLLLVAFLWSASHGSYGLAISLHLRDLGASSGFIGVCWAVGTIAEVVLMAGSATLLHRARTPRLLSVGLLFVAVRWALIGSIRSLPVLLALQPLHAITFGLIWVSAMAFVKERAPAHLLTSAQGLFSGAMAVGSGAGILAWGPVYASYGGAMVFRTAAVVALIGGAATLLLARVHRRREARTSARA
jgi:PPP family 3-phenylpropionic acid transporter